MYELLTGSPPFNWARNEVSHKLVIHQSIHIAASQYTWIASHLIWTFSNFIWITCQCIGTTYRWVHHLTIWTVFISHPSVPVSLFDWWFWIVKQKQLQGEMNKFGGIHGTESSVRVLFTRSLSLLCSALSIALYLYGSFGLCLLLALCLTLPPDSLCFTLYLSLALYLVSV